MHLTRCSTSAMSSLGGNNDYGIASSKAAIETGGIDRRISMAQTKGVRPKGTEKHEELTSNEVNMSFAKWSLADNAEWTCKACTFLNDNPRHLKCAACGTTRESSSSTTAAQASSSAILNEQLQDIDEEEYYANDRHGQSEQTVPNETNYEADIIEERLQEHIAMQQEMLDEIQREREENDRKMKELRGYQQRILDKLEKEKVERDKMSTSNCPAQQDTKKVQDEPTKISISQSNGEEQVVEDYRRHLMEQKLALEESSRHIQSMSGLVKMKGSGKSGSLSRGLQKTVDESKKEDKMTSLQRMKKEWIQRERKLRTLRNQMRTKLKNEEDHLRNTAA